MRCFWLAQVKKDFLSAYSYKVSFFGQFFFIFVSVLPLFYLSKTFDITSSQHMDKYGSNYFLFAVLGVSLTAFLITTLSAAARSVREAQTLGYIDLVINSKINSGYIVICSMIYPSIIGIVRILVFLSLSYGLQPFSLSYLNLFFLFLLIVLLLLPFIGIGLISASFVLIFKQGDPVINLINVLITLLSGTIYPISVLPDTLRCVAYFIPFTHGLELIRSLVINNSIDFVSIDVMFGLLISSMLSLSLGLIIFNKAVRLTKFSGKSGRY